MNGTSRIGHGIMAVVALAIEVVLILGVVLASTGIMAEPIPDAAWPTPGGPGAWHMTAPAR
jgi:hypothetical protein